MLLKKELEKKLTKCREENASCMSGSKGLKPGRRAEGRAVYWSSFPELLHSQAYFSSVVSRATVRTVTFHHVALP